MIKSIENLFDNKEPITLSLNSIHYQLLKYRYELKKLSATYQNQANTKEMNSYAKIFKFYDRHLIPALKKSIEMDQKHIALIRKNPDSKFKPSEEEAHSYQGIFTKFEDRFEQIHKEFYAFTQRLKQNN